MSTATKICSHCKQEFPATREFFPPQKRGKYGLNACCKKCTAIQIKKRKHGDNYDEWKLARDIKQQYIDDLKSQGLKLCPKCGKTKAATLEFFSFRKERDSLNSWCRDCCSRYKRERRQDPKSRDHILKKDKQYRDTLYSTSKGRERSKENKKRLYRTNSVFAEHKKESERQRRLKPENQDRLRKQRQEYNRTPKGRAVDRVKHLRRKAHKKNLPNNFTSQDWERCLEYFNHCCAVCGRSIDLWTTLSADHWIALSDHRPDNPGTVVTNIVPLCHPIHGGISASCYCNSSKQDSDASQWLTRRFGNQKAKQILKRINTYFEWVKNQDKL